MRAKWAAIGVLGAIFSGIPARSPADEPLLRVDTVFTEGVLAKFDPQERVSIRLKDAKLTDVVRTLGMLAKMPIYVDPDVEGSVTMNVQDMPFEKVLGILSKSQGISLRIEKGMLVASRSTTSLLPALLLPEKFETLPRMPAEEYSKSFLSPPLYMNARWNESETCARLTYDPKVPPTIILPVSADPAKTVHVTQFGYEPVTRTRFLVVESSVLAQVAALGPTRGFAAQTKNDSEELSVSIEPRKPEGDACAEPQRETPLEKTPVTLLLSIREAGPDGNVRSTPRVQLRPGQTFTVGSSLRDEQTGHHRSFTVYGYVSHDGKSVAAALAATSIWVDPKDGRQYMFAQVGDVENRLFPLTTEGALAGALPAGVATDRPLEMAISLAPAPPPDPLPEGEGEKKSPSLEGTGEKEKPSSGEEVEMRKPSY